MDNTSNTLRSHPHLIHDSKVRLYGLWGAVVCVCALVLAPTSAQAQEASTDDVEAMQAATETYFAGEKRGAIGFGAVGAVSVVTGGAFLLTDSGALKGAAIPTLTFGVVDLLIGVFVYSAADDRAARLSEQASEDLAGFKDGEETRIGNLDTAFEVLYVLETALLLGGLSTAAFGRIENDDAVMGFGLGLAAQMPPLLVLDGLADTRGEVYMEALEGLKLDDEGQAKVSGELEGGLVGLRLSF